MKLNLDYSWIKKEGMRIQWTEKKTNFNNETRISSHIKCLWNTSKDTLSSLFVEITLVSTAVACSK